MSTCRSCDAEVVWVASAATGTLMPLDAEPRPDGNIYIEGDKAHVYPAGSLFPAPGPLHLSHFVTCPNADQHRRRK